MRLTKLCIFIAGCVALSASIVMVWPGCKKSEKSPPMELVVCSYGGSFQEAQRQAFFLPFEQETGIRVIEAQWSGEFAKLKAMVESGKPTWDLVTAAEGSIIARGIKEGLLEPIDYQNIDRAKLFPEAITEFSVGFDFFTTVLAFNSYDYPNGTVRPKSWADFWNVEKFPGGRSLRRDPRTTLEFALLADGQQMQSLYPLDIDRAFRSLDRIKSHVTVWWSSGHQPAQLLADREVKLVSAFNGRIWAAAVKDSVPLQVEWNQGALDLDAWIIPKGARNREAAMRLIEFTCRPEAQIALTKYINYSPTRIDAYSQMDSSARSVLPTSPENGPKQFVFDGVWWAENEAIVIERWNQWLLK